MVSGHPGGARDRRVVVENAARVDREAGCVVEPEHAQPRERRAHPGVVGVARVLDERERARAERSDQVLAAGHGSRGRVDRERGVERQDGPELEAEPAGPDPGLGADRQRAVLDERARVGAGRDAGPVEGLRGRAAGIAARSAIEELSPLAAAGQVRAPVELAVPPEDPYFPSGEARALADSLPNVRLTVTATLDHTRPMASLRRLGGLRKFEAFVVRGLAAARG